MNPWLLGMELLFVLYFVGLNGGYLTLLLVAMWELRHGAPARALEALPRVYRGFEPPISVLSPAYNEQATIAASVRSLLQLRYPEYEVVVINDGSRDDTMEVLQREFQLVPFPEAYRRQLPCQPLRAIYRSTIYPQLRVLDKANGGKADALNAGINAARYPLFCAIDADSVLERDSLAKVARPFLDDPDTVAVGGTIRIANGCRLKEGQIQRAGLPASLLARFQILEYLRAFLFGRLGWNPLNALLIISGAFGLFNKRAVLEVGGYRHDTIGEDMELIVRLHRHLRLARRRYRITFLPDPVCWTEAPEDLATLRNQRIRWQRGLGESLSNNLPLLCHPRGGTVGWLAFPFFAVFEWWGPLFEVAGYLFTAWCLVAGWIDWPVASLFLLASVGLGILLSLSALLLEELSFHLYPGLGAVGQLAGLAVLENLGYRQLNSWWRLVGLVRWIRGGPATWGTMTRRGVTADAAVPPAAEPPPC